MPGLLTAPLHGLRSDSTCAASTRWLRTSTSSASSVARYSWAARTEPWRSSPTRWRTSRESAANSAFEATRAATWSSVLAPRASAGMPHSRPATNAPSGWRARRAAPTKAHASSRCMRNDTRLLGPLVEVPGAICWVVSHGIRPKAEASASRATSEGVTPRPRARSINAALRPRKSIVRRSREVAAITSPSARGACPTSAPRRLSCNHSCIHLRREPRPGGRWIRAKIQRLGAALALSSGLTTIGVFARSNSAWRQLIENTNTRSPSAGRSRCNNGRPQSSADDAQMLSRAWRRARPAPGAAMQDLGKTMPHSDHQQAWDASLGSWLRRFRLKESAADKVIERVVTSPTFSAVITLLIVLAGAAASLFTEAIRAFGTPFGHLPSGTASVGAAAFWLLVVLAVALLVLNQAGIYRRSTREQQAMTSSLAQLDLAVRRLNTLPSENFLPSFQDSFREAIGVALLPVVDEGAGIDQVNAAVRAVLAAIADTAKDFDGAPSDTIYGANIMIFRGREQLSQITDALQLVHVGPSHIEYSGALELLPQLSTCTAEPGKVDRRTSPISLPVPSDNADYYDSGSRATKSVVIPGAPTSYVKATFDAFATIDAFLQRLHDHTSLDRRLVGRVQDYFTIGPGKDIKSFASLPIVGFAEPGSGEAGARSNDPQSASVMTPLGVLNIHSQRPGLLADNGATLFAPLMGPFLSLLAILLVHRQELAVAASCNPAELLGGEVAERTMQ